MAIIGLESDNYCVHCPIPIMRPGASDSPTRLQILIDNEEMLVNPPMLCDNGEGALLDLAPWVRQFMPNIQDMITYTGAPQVTPNPYSQEMTIRLYNSTSEDQEVKTFIHCSDDNVLDDDLTAIKAWQCYPFSYHNSNNVISQVLATPPTVPNKIVEYDNSCCAGTYIKWLNQHGYYSYWLFKKSVSEELEADEIFNMPEDIFDSPRIRGRVTAGFTTTDTLTVREVINKKYLELLRSLVYSPDVYVLRDDYVLGDDVSTSDWRRVIQDSPSIEYDRRNGTFEFEIDLVLPEPCTIKRI